MTNPEQRFTAELLHRVAVVTGGAGGIGLAIAHALARAGASVAITDLHEGRLHSAVEALRLHGRNVAGYSLDAGDVASCEALAANVASQLGNADIVVANAALNEVSPLHDLSEDRWDSVMRLDVKGPWALTKACVPSMLASGRGSIVNISSVGSWVATAGQGAYSAAKAALQSMTRTFAVELGPFGIRCNAVAPGFIATQFVEKHLDRFADDIARIPLRRLGTPEEIAEIVVFLASDRAAYITGETVAATGGWYHRP